MRLSLAPPRAWSLCTGAAFLLLTLPVQAAPPRRGAATEECPAASRLELNVATWKAALKRASTPERRDEVLGKIKLSLDVTDAETSDESDDHAPGPTRATLLGIDEHFVRLAATELPDHVIHIRYRVETSDDTAKATTDLVQVLRPFGGTSWCILGSDLSQRDDTQSKRETYALGFVPLLNAKTRAIEVQMVQSQLRHTETMRQYWIVDGFTLRKIFDEEIGSMDNIDNGRDTRVKTGTLTLVGGFPKRIEIRQVIKHAICDAQVGDVPCDDNEKPSAITFVYNGKAFARRK